MDRRSAQRVTIIAQVASVVGVGVVGWALLTQGEPTLVTGYDPVALVQTRSDAAQATVQTPVDTGPTSFPEYAIDAKGVADRLALIAGAPEPAAAPETTGEVETAQGATEPTRDASVESRVRYAGMIRSGGRRIALLSVDGAQRMIEAGERLSGFDGDAPLIEAISDSAVRLTVGSRVVVVQRAERSGPSITSVSGAEVGETPEGVGTSLASKEVEQTPDRAAQFERRRDAIRKALERGNIDERQAERLLGNIDREEEGGTIRERAERRERVDIPVSERAPRGNPVRAGRLRDRRNTQDSSGDE